MNREWSGVAIGDVGAGHPRTLSEVVTLRLRDAIIRGRLRPGQPLWQDRLAEEFGVSRVPIRESLRQLAAEGLVTLKSHRSAVVAELSINEIDELYAMITQLEILAAKRGVSRLTDQDLQHMSELYERMKAIRDEPIEWYVLNGDFHRTLVMSSGWMRVVRTIDECRKNVMRYVNVHDFYRRQVTPWNERNGRLLRACRSRDAARVVAILEEMGAKAAQAVRDELKKRGQVGSSAT